MVIYQLLLNKTGKKKHGSRQLLTQLSQNLKSRNSEPHPFEDIKKKKRANLRNINLSTSNPLDDLAAGWRLQWILTQSNRNYSTSFNQLRNRKK